MKARKLLGGLLLVTSALFSPAPQASILVNAAPGSQMEAMLAYLQPPRTLQGTLFSLSHGDACRALAASMTLVQVGISGRGQDVTVYHDAAASRYVVVRGSGPVRVTVTAQKPTYRGGTWLEE